MIHHLYLPRRVEDVIHKGHCQHTPTILRYTKYIVSMRNSKIGIRYNDQENNGAQHTT